MEEHFSTHSRPAHSVSPIAATALAGLALVCASCAIPPLTPGKVYGDVVFLTPSADVLSYVAAHPVAAAPPAPAPSVQPARLYVPGDSVATTAGQYAAANDASDPQKYKAAQYELHPNVDGASIDRLLAIDALAFADGNSYRFGSIDRTAPAAIACNGIVPESANPAGTKCDASECAALLNVGIQFTGAQQDLDAIRDDPLAPIFCSVQARVEEAPGSGTYVLQAASGPHQFALADLESGNARVPLLVRSTSAPVGVGIGCFVKIKSGESGFVVIPGLGTTPFNASQIIPLAGCGQTLAPPPYSVPVERHGGKLSGYLGLDGHAVSGARVCVDRFDSGLCTSPADVPAGSQPSQEWKFDGIVQGPHAMVAQALYDGGEGALTWPHREGPNGLVTVMQNASTDIGATFVSRAVSAQGRVRLFDPDPSTHLGSLVTDRFSWVTSATSYVLAQGDAGVAPGSNGGSGIGAYSRARMTGAFDPATKEAPLAYRVLLNGLSPDNAALDGSQFKATPWDISSIDVYVRPPTQGYEETIVAPAVDMHYVVDPSQVGGSPIDVPEQRLCFARQTLVLHVDPSVGTMYSPWAQASTDGLYSPTTTSMTPFSYASAYGSGAPISAATSAATASVDLNLVEGYRYKVNASLNLAPAGGGASSWLNLPAVFVPDNGVVGCGSPGSPCLDVGGTSGTSGVLQVSIAAPSGATPAYCLANGSLAAEVDVRSTSNITRIAYVVDPAGDPQAACEAPTATVLCPAGCGSNASFPLNLANLPPGPHRVHACATSDSGCSAFQSYGFYVDTQPPALQCAPDFTVTLDGATTVPSSDPRIAGALNAQVVGNCDQPFGLADDRPAVFPLGATPVNFTAAGIGSCTTTVTVKSIERALWLVDDDPALGEVALRKRSFLDNSVDVVAYSSASPFYFRFNPDGTRIAVVPQAGAIRILDAATFAALATFAGPSGFRIFDVAFDPLDSTRYAMVGTSNSNPDQHSIFVYKNGAPLSQFDLSQWSGATQPRTPAIAWSPDATRISVAFTQLPAAADTYTFRVAEWPVAGGQLVAPGDSVEEDRPGRANREKLREMVYQDAGRRVAGTSLALTRSVGTAGSVQLDVVAAGPNSDLDLTPDGKAAAWIVRYDLAPQSIGWIYGVTGLEAGGHVQYHVNRAVLYAPSSIAISSDAKYVAVAVHRVSPPGAAVVVFDFPTFAPVNIIPETNPRNLEFKPFIP